MNYQIAKKLQTNKIILYIKLKNVKNIILNENFAIYEKTGFLNVYNDSNDN